MLICFVRKGELQISSDGERGCGGTCGRAFLQSKRTVVFRKEGTAARDNQSHRFVCFFLILQTVHVEFCPRHDVARAVLPFFWGGGEGWRQIVD